MLIKNSEHSVSINDMNHYGYGVAHIDGIAVFVPGTAVGDAADIKIIKTAKSYAVGKLIKITTPSTHRNAPGDICPAALRCGGCNYQHISYETELLQKQKDVMFALRKEGFRDIEVLPCLSAHKTRGYRNKAQYPVGYDKEGRVVAGFYKMKSHEIISDCPCSLGPDVFADIVSDVVAFANECGISAYDEEKHKGLLRHIYLRSSQNGEEIMLCLVINGKKLPKAEKLIELIKGKYPAVVGIVINSNTKKTNVILGDTTECLWGREYIRDTLCGVSFKISARSFYQVNHDGAEILFSKARELLSLSDEDTLLDLYCGIGTVGLIVGQNAKKLIGIEIIPDAVENARENARENGIENAEFICADAASTGEILKRADITAIAVDPPRSGLDKSLIDYIADLAPKKLLYISCNSATLARDMKHLAEYGYRADFVQPVDMFPRTGHCECCVLMRKYNG